MIVLFKRQNNFGDKKVWKKKKKILHPFPPKMGMFAEKSQKITIFQL